MTGSIALVLIAVVTFIKLGQIYEPPNSVHTLEIVEDDTHVWFQIYGANLNLDADGEVESVSDGSSTLATYLRLCEQAGLPMPNVFIPQP